MSENNYVKFTCRQCGSNKLAYQEYVKSITPAEFMNCGKLYYTPAIIYENDFIPESRGFCCRDCGHMLEHCGAQVRTEKELWNYFEELSCRPDKPSGVPDRQEYKVSERTLDLIDRIEEDRTVTPKLERDM